MYFKCECTKTCWSDITQYKRDSNALKKKKRWSVFPSDHGPSYLD